MGAAKRINTGNYTIDTFKNNGNPLGNVDITTNTVYIDGNLVVTGTRAETQVFNTTDPIFHVNANLTVSDSPHTGYSGLENNRGAQSSVGLYWDENGTYTGQWIANNGSTVGPILTSFNIPIAKTTDSPASVPDFVIVTGNDAESGGTGLFINAGSGATELVSVKTARKFAIIFG